MFNILALLNSFYSLKKNYRLNENYLESDRENIQCHCNPQMFSTELLLNSYNYPELENSLQNIA